MHPTELIQEHHRLVQRVAAGREKFEHAFNVVAAADMDAAIQTAALSIVANLRLTDAFPALSVAVTIDAVRPKLLAALKAELIDLPEANLAAFQLANAAALKNHLGIT